VVDAAHARGMRVLLDLVVNHVHEESAYWIDHPGTPWFHAQYVCGFEQPINCWFADYLPDLDFQESAVRNQLIADAAFWAEETGVDGYRVDALKHFEHVVGRTLRAEVGCARGDRRLALLHGGRDVRRQGGQAELVEYISPRELDGQFDFPLYWEIVRTIARGEGTLYDLETVLRTTQGYYPPFSVMARSSATTTWRVFISHANGDIADLYGNGAKEQGWNTPPAQPAGTVPYAKLETRSRCSSRCPACRRSTTATRSPRRRRRSGQSPHDDVGSGARGAGVGARAHRHALGSPPRESRARARHAPPGVDGERPARARAALERRRRGPRAYLAVNRGATARSIAPQVGAPNGTSYVDAVGGASATVSGGSLAVDVPAYGSALYLPAP